MPSGDCGWAELSSQNERVFKPGETDSNSARTAHVLWDELASNRERLADSSDPMFGLAGHIRGSTGMRLVTGAA